MNKPTFSIIIPHRNSVDTLIRLLRSIPDDDRIETIVVDNSDSPLRKADLTKDKKFILKHSDPKRFAGGARNEGLTCATGEWLVFADADDFFTPSAFDVFFNYASSEYDLIYFKVNSVYDDTLKPSNRNKMWCDYIDDYLSGKTDELECRLSYLVPWGKMIRRELVESNNILFDEVIAANDAMFSTRVAYSSRSFSVSTECVYTVTTRKGSLANSRNLEVLQSRYLVTIRRNLFLKEKGLAERQASIMVYLYKSLGFGIKTFSKFLFVAIKNKQNIFRGYRNWLKTLWKISTDDKEKKEYLVR